MDTGDLPNEASTKSKAKTSSRLQNQEQKGREIIQATYSDNRRGTSDFEAWLLQPNMRTFRDSSALQKTQFIVPKRLNETQKFQVSDPSGKVNETEPSNENK